MPADPKRKYQKKYRLRLNGAYCSLNMKLSEKGVAIPDIPAEARDSAAVFDTRQGADACIRRTTELQNEVRISMYASWEKFRVLDFIGTPEPEEFFVLVPAEEEAAP